MNKENSRGDSNYRLGLLYLKGELRTKDLKKARTYFGKAMEEGHFAAGLEYAKMCMNGDGGDRDMTEACRAYKKIVRRHADDTSNPRGIRGAQAVLGDMYFMGEGTERNYEEALACYVAAEKLGYFGRESRVAYMFEHGIGVERDLVSAAIWYQKAVARNNMNAQEPCKRIMALLSADEKQKVSESIMIRIP